MPQQQWNPTEYQRNAGFVPQLAGAVLDLLAASPGERILDLGCGDGVIAADLIAKGCSVHGVDASEEMVAAARKRGVKAEVMSGTALTFHHEFDAVFSNAALHWMKPPEKVIAGVWNALKPGGRYVAECGGKGNVAMIEAALEAALRNRGIDPKPLNPWYYASAEEYRALLEKQGFTVSEIAIHPRPTPLPGDISGWLAIFAGSFLGGMAESEQRAVVDEVREALRPKLFQDNAWIADYARLRFKATKPA